MKNINLRALRSGTVVMLIAGLGAVGTAQAADEEPTDSKTSDKAASVEDNAADSAKSDEADPKVLIVEKIAAADSEQGKQSGVRCRKVAPVGTRIRRTRCVSVAQQEARTREDRRRLGRVQQNSRPPPAPPAVFDK